MNNPPKNVMFGTSPVDQKTANGLIVQLSKSMVKDSFLLNLSWKKIDLYKVKGDTDTVLLDLVDWVINGGEWKWEKTFNCDWARLIRDDCKRKGPILFQTDRKNKLFQMI
jgi:protein gp37